MRRGCIAIGKVECDGCHRPLRYGEHYLVANGQGEKKQRFCVDCCVSHGYTTYRTKKGTQVVSFLTEE